MDWRIEALQLLEKLVTIPSINPGEEKHYNSQYGEKEVGEALLSYIKDYFPSFSCWKEEVLEGRFNCYASYYCGKEYPTILLETHLDTVDIKGMEINPFNLYEEDGKVFGRGACDAKGQLTAMLIGLKKALTEAKGRLPVNILLAAVIDEEHQHRGVDYLVQNSIKADLAIIGEPTQLKFGAFHKGSVRFKLSTSGKSVHSSTPWEGENAIEKMCEVIDVLKVDAKNEVESILHSMCGKSSLSVTKISGGEQVNIIPNECSIHVDRRLNPQENWEDALENIKKLVKKKVRASTWKDTTWHNPYLIDPSLSNDLSRKGIQQIRKIMEKIDSNFEFVGLQFGCDASKIEPANIPAVVFGPGSIEQAHTINEWIAEEELLRAIDIYSKIFQNFHVRR